MKESMKEIMARLKPNIEAARTAEEFHKIALEILDSLDGGEDTIEKITATFYFECFAMATRPVSVSSKKLNIEFSLEERENEILVIKLKGDLNSPEINLLNSKIDTLIKEGHKKFILDLSQVVFVDLTDLGKMSTCALSCIRVAGLGCFPRTIDEVMEAFGG